MSENTAANAHPQGVMCSSRPSTTTVIETTAIVPTLMTSESVMKGIKAEI